MSDKLSRTERLKSERQQRTKQKTPSQKQPPKKKNNTFVYRRLFWLLLIIIISVGGYSYYQFKQGQGMAIEERELTEEELLFTGAKVTNKTENFLLIGVDSRGEQQSRSDSIMVISWDKEANKLRTISFMRDIYADIPGHDQQKLNAAYYHGGAQLLADTLQEMFDLPIHHYAMIDFVSFEKMIDIIAPDGITIDVEKDMYEKIYVQLYEGVHNLNGQELLGYARFRADSEGDFGRVRRQQQVITALKEQLLSTTTLMQAPKLIGAMQGYVSTDLQTSEQIGYLVKLITEGSLDVEGMTVPVEGSYVDYRDPTYGLVLDINVDTNTRKIKEFIGASH